MYLFDLGHDGVGARMHQLLLLAVLLPLLVARSRLLSSFLRPFVPPFLLLLVRQQRSGEVRGAIRAGLNTRLTRCINKKGTFE